MQRWHYMFFIVALAPISHSVLLPHMRSLQCEEIDSRISYSIRCEDNNKVIYRRNLPLLSPQIFEDFDIEAVALRREYLQKRFDEIIRNNPDIKDVVQPIPTYLRHPFRRFPRL